MGRRSKGFNKGELDTVNSRLASLIDVADISVPKIIKKVSGNIQRDVTAAAPVDTGNLRRSIYRDVGQYKARIFVDTTRTETRQSARNFNYGHTVEHGRSGRYKTTPFWYDNVMRNLSLIDEKIKNVLAKAAMNKKK